MDIKDINTIYTASVIAAFTLLFLCQIYFILSGIWLRDIPKIRGRWRYDYHEPDEREKNARNSNCRSYVAGGLRINTGKTLGLTIKSLMGDKKQAAYD